jgi:glutathione S-transferase
VELYYTPNSPDSRVARVLALDKGIDVTFVPVAVRESADHLLEYNPAAKVPSLKLTNGRVLSETRLICEHFENLSTGGFLAAVTDIDGRCREGLVSGLLDGVAVWVREIRRVKTEQSPGILELESARAARCLGHIERCWNMDMIELTYSSTMLASAIELIETRFQTRWRAENPKLSQWFDRISQNPGLLATAPQEA